MQIFFYERNKDKMKRTICALFVCIIAAFALLGLAACGDETSFSVNFIVDGEVYATFTPQSSGEVELPREPTKEGFTFAGWFLDEEFKREFYGGSLTDVKLTDNVSVYAKWTEGDASHTHTASAWITDVEASCSKEGAKHKECTECGALLESAKIEKLAHSNDEAVRENEQDATCTTVGHYDSVVYCSVCHEEISREQKEITKKTTHTPAEAVSENVHDSTCAAVGHYDSVIYCSVCHEEVSREQKEIAKKTTHTPAEAVSENVHDSTCAAVGHYDSVIYCSVCHEEVSREQKEIAKKTTHTPAEAVSENVHDSTCAAVGHYDSVIYCSVCHEEISREQKEIEKKDTHTPAKAVMENVQDSTCIAVGHYDSVVYCSVCEAELFRITGITIARTTHNMQDGTCTHCGALESSAGLKFELNGDGETYAVVGIGTCTDTAIVIDIYNNKKVTSIRSSAFSACSGLTSVTIGNSVTSIGSEAFRYCYKLVEVINKSSLKITPSSSDYGYVAYYAKEVHTGESKIKNVNDYLFYPSDDTNYLVAYVGTDTELTLPESYSGKSYEIYQYTFHKNASITNVNIPNGVTSIGESAFSGCSELTSVTIPNGVTSIGSLAFSGCSGLTSITIPNSVTSIGRSAFSSCGSLESITLPFVGNYATATTASSSTLFGYIFGTSSYTGSTATTQYYSSSYEKTTYYIPSTLKSVTITGGNILYGAFYNCKNLINVTLGDSVTNIGDSAFYNCNGLTSITIPDSITSIGNLAFGYCSEFTSMSIPDSVTSIGGGAFYGCSELTSITIPFVGATKDGSENAHFGYIFGTIPSSLKTVIITGGTIIDSSAFTSSGCSGLTSIVIPDSVTSISKGAFSGCTGLTSITIPFAGATKDGSENAHFGYIFGASAFYDNDSCVPLSLKAVIITDGTSIGWNAFYGCSGLTSITIPNNVTSIGSSAFSGCTGLTSIMIPNNVTSIGSFAFSGCTGLTSITIPESTTSIGSSAFKNCSGLTSITIPDNFTSIDESAFYGCSGLTSITIPNNVTSIGSSAFSGCTGLTSIMIPNNVTSIGSFAFSGCSGLTSVTIPDGVTSIGNGAFNRCTSLINITVPNSVTSIGEGAFYGCSELTSITIPFVGATKDGSKNTYFNYIFGGKNELPSNLKSVIIMGDSDIGENAFYDCAWLTSVTIGNGVTSIGNDVFYGCTGLTSITIPGSVTSIGARAFNSCKGLTSVTICDGVTTIVGLAFYNCTGLTSITIPDSVTSIGDSAFSGCTRLTSVTIGNGVTSIGSYTFKGCTNLASVTLGANVKNIANEAFKDCNKLVEIINKSSLDIKCGDKTNGYIAYKAMEVHTCPSKFKEVNDYLFYTFNGTNYLIGYAGANAELTLPKSFNGENYAIYQYAFYQSATLTSITMPNAVTSIGNNAFEYCQKLASINIPNSVKAIGDYAFSGCKALTSVTLVDGLESIGKSAFVNCYGLTSIVIPNNVKIGITAFNSCYGLKSVTIGNGVTFGDSSFYYCFSLVEVINKSSCNITAGSTAYGYVGYYAKEVHSGESKIKNVNDYLFYTVGGTKHLLSYIGTDTELTLPESYNGEGYEIYRYAFFNNASITRITISNSVTSIGENAFDGCLGLTSVYYKGSSEEWSKISIGNYNYYLTNATLYYYSESAPTEEGNYWHYDESGNVTIWSSES